MADLIADGVDLSTIGFVLEPGSRDLLSGGHVDHRMAPIPGRAGATHLSLQGQTRAKVFTLNAHVVGTSAANLRARIDEVKFRLEHRDVQLIFPDDATRYITARMQRAQWSSPGPEWNVVAGADHIRRARLQFVAEDPWFFDVTAQTIGFSTATAMPLGDAISLPVITLIGAVTDPVITYKDGGGATIRTMGFTIVMGADTLVIDCDALTLKLNAGAATDAALLTSGDFIELDPRDYTDWLSGDPTLEISPVPATSATAVYKKAWR